MKECLVTQHQSLFYPFGHVIHMECVLSHSCYRKRSLKRWSPDFRLQSNLFTSRGKEKWGEMLPKWTRSDYSGVKKGGPLTWWGRRHSAVSVKHCFKQSAGGEAWGFGASAPSRRRVRVGAWRGGGRVIEREAEVGKSAPSSRRQLQAGGGETPAETPSTEESGFISQVHHWIKNPWVE